MAFERPPTAYTHDREEDLPALGEGGETLSYRQSVSWVSHLWLRHCSLASNEQSPLNPLATLEELDKVGATLQPHLLDPSRGTTTQQVIEYYALELHMNFVRSGICRRRRSDANISTFEGESREILLSTLKKALKGSARAYVHLLSMDSRAIRSWAFIHNGLAAVLLLSLMRDTRYDPEVRSLQENLIQNLVPSNFAADSFAGPEAAPELTEAHKRAVRALESLKRLTEEETNQQRGQTTEDHDDAAYGSHGQISVSIPKELVQQDLDSSQQTE